MRPLLALCLLAACGSVADNQHDAAVDTHVDTLGVDAPTCAANPTGLAGRWRGDMTTNDELGAYNGVSHGSNFGYVPGKHGMAFLFDGATNVVTIDDADTLWPAGSFSIEAWVKTTASGVVVEKYQCENSCPSTIATAFWSLSVGGTGNPAFSLRTDASQVVAMVTDTLHDVHDGQWHHLVGVRDSSAGTSTLYVDGVLGVVTNLVSDQLGPMTNVDGEVDPVLIGSAVTGGTMTYNTFFGGAIDEVSYYTSALGASQVAAIYAAPDGECH